MRTTNQIIIVTITILLTVTISATYYAAGPGRKPIYDSVLFFKQEYASTSIGGVAMAVPFDYLASALKPLPTSFEISRRWGGVDNIADQGVSLWTILRAAKSSNMDSTPPIL